MPGRPRASMPGTWRGAPVVAGGQGSGAGPRTVNIPTSASTRRGNGGMTPTTSYLLVLVGAEIAAYCLLRYAFRRAHGG